ncbi:MAG: phytanoyl-CoA dioxygenase family protein [Acidimicrobiales bacterium]
MTDSDRTERQNDATPPVNGVLSEDQWRSWSESGYIRVAKFAEADTCTAMLRRVTEIVRDPQVAADLNALVMPERNKAGMPTASPEDGVSKVFRIHRDAPFGDFATSQPVVDSVAELIGPDLDVFLSQFIFKTPGAWGQPWHQDSFYFPFEPARPVVGVWLAVTAATLENGCLHVLPGSHHEPVHQHVEDRRTGANLGYVEIIDHDFSASVPVLMDPGDLLIFDSHLMHRSTDNESDSIRAAMVYHYAATGTIDHSPLPLLVNDWMPARRQDDAFRGVPG